MSSPALGWPAALCPHVDVAQREQLWTELRGGCGAPVSVLGGS